MLSLFFELLQIALGHRSGLSHIPSEREWRELFFISQKQALLGVVYAAIEKLPPVQRPERKFLLRWHMVAESVKKKNSFLESKYAVISQKFYKDGFRNVILKGYGVASYYRIDGLEKYRMPGDVDIWLDGNRDKIISYVHRYMPDSTIVYHHADFPKIDDVDIEVHFTPSWMNSFFTNRKLQNFFAVNKDKQFAATDYSSGEIPVPTLAFNRIYILIHIYRHLFLTGIGLKQLLDYYYVLKQGFTEKERVETIQVLASLKMKRFARAVMWLLHEAYGLENEFLLIEPDEKEGRFLLAEVMRSGNFGMYDKSVVRNGGESDLYWGMRKLKRLLRFAFAYPSEVFWSPFFKVWHYFWRRKVNVSSL